MGVDIRWVVVLAAAIMVATAFLGQSQHVFTEASSTEDMGGWVMVTPFNLTTVDSVKIGGVPFPVGVVEEIATFELAGHTYAAVASKGVIQVLNLTDPQNIAWVGSIGKLEVWVDSIGNFGGREVWGGIRISTFESAGRPYAAVVSGLDVRVLNLTDPQNIVSIYSIDHDFGPGEIIPGIATFESAGHTYAIVLVLLGDSYCLPDPFSPCNDLDIDDTTILQVLNLTDPQNIFPTVRIVYDGIHPYYSRHISAFESAGHTYAIAPAHNYTMHVLNLTDPNRIISISNITEKDNRFLRLGGWADTFELDDRPYVAVRTYSGMTMLNLTDPQNTVPVGSILNGDGYWIPVDQSMDAIEAGLPMIAFDNGFGDGFWLYGSGLQLNGVDNIATFELDGRYYAAVSSYTNIQVLDLTDPQNMLLVGALDYDDSLRGGERYTAIFKSDGHVYAVVGVSGYVQVIQLTTNVT